MDLEKAFDSEVLKLVRLIKKCLNETYRTPQVRAL
jgi:hypothetical protein